MDIVNDVMRGASETYDSLFGGDETQKKNKKMIYIGVAVLIIVLIIVFVFVVYIWYKNKTPIRSGSNRVASGCCGAKDAHRLQTPLFDVNTQDYEESLYEKFGDQSVAFSPGTGYDNISMPFATSKPDATPSSALGYNPAQPPALVRQKYLSTNQVRPYITENEFANYAGLA